MKIAEYFLCFLFGCVVMGLVLIIGHTIYSFCEQSQLVQFMTRNQYAVVMDKEFAGEVRMRRAGFCAEFTPTLKLKGVTTNDEIIVEIYRTQYNVINQGDVIATDSLHLR